MLLAEEQDFADIERFSDLIPEIIPVHQRAWTAR
jgi:hypothetical protein